MSSISRSTIFQRMSRVAFATTAVLALLCVHLPTASSEPSVPPHEIMLDKGWRITRDVLDLQIVGPEQVGLGLDYIFDQAELDMYLHSHPNPFPPERGYRAGTALADPGRTPVIDERLLERGYSEVDVQDILGHDNLPVTRALWRAPACGDGGIACA